MKVATIAEKMPFYDMVIRLTHLWSQCIATHQDRNRLRISDQSVNELLIGDFRLRRVQRPVCGRQVPVLGILEVPEVSQRNTSKSS